MQNKLRVAFLAKEKADNFLANLENLKEEKTVGDAQYRVLKIEYTQLRDDALSQINTLKNVIRKELDEKITKLEIVEQELGYLDARFKVGQLSPKDYMSKSKGPKGKLMDLEKRVSELQNFLDASISAELGGGESARKVLGLGLATPKKQVVEQMAPMASMQPETRQESNYPPPPLPFPPVPPSQVMPAQMPPMPMPPPPPPPIEASDLQIMPDRVVEGSNLGIIVIVTNVVPSFVQYRVDLKIDGVVKESRDLNLMPEEIQELTFVVAAGKPGTYQVEIGGLTGSFTVLAAETIRSLQE